MIFIIHFFLGEGGQASRALLNTTQLAIQCLVLRRWCFSSQVVLLKPYNAVDYLCNTEIIVTSTKWCLWNQVESRTKLRLTSFKACVLIPVLTLQPKDRISYKAKELVDH